MTVPNALRILDANANRAREALRVAEDAARFVLDDAGLCGDLKKLRHDLAAALQALPRHIAIELHRDTAQDVGTAISGTGEFKRQSIADVVVAAGKRLSEALRALEEYGKLIDTGFAATIEQLRYRGYDLEQRLNAALGCTVARQWRLCVLISAELCPKGDWLAVAKAVVEAGGDCIQLREKELPSGELLARARQLVALCRLRGVTTIINDRPDVALLAGADGVHLGQTDLPCTEVRKFVGRQLLIGISTSRLAQAEQARRDGADYCGVGPMFPTSTKQVPKIVGAAYLRQYMQWGKLPHLAIGGVTPDNVAQLIEAGARGIAVSSAICNAANPADVTRRLVEALAGAAGQRTA